MNRDGLVAKMIGCCGDDLSLQAAPFIEVAEQYAAACVAEANVNRSKEISDACNRVGFDMAKLMAENSKLRAALEKLVTICARVRANNVVQIEQSDIADAKDIIAETKVKP